MFERLTESLQKVFRALRGYGRLSERNIQDALREVRLALLEADVNYQVVREFTERVKERVMGREVLESVTPGQQFIKHIYDEMVRLLGSTASDFDFSETPTKVLLLGLHGSGKTTTAAKLAARWKKEGRKILLIPCDLRRPAAVEQLRTLGQKVGVEVLMPGAGEKVEDLARRALEVGKPYHVLIFDTGGRFQIDTELVEELKRLRQIVAPRNVILVLDAAIGQESVHVAETFHKELGLTGLILTKLDGDARGGAALSVRAVTGCPVLLVGTGEKPEDLEPFYPDRMASRILGMGDVVSFVEKAQQALDEKQMQRLQEVMEEGRFDLNDFLEQMRQVRKMGALSDLLKLLPGADRVLPPGLSPSVLERDFKRMEAILCSMTPEERRRPEILNASRKRRIAAGSGTRIQDVNELLRNFEKAREMARQMKHLRKKLIGGEKYAK